LPLSTAAAGMVDLRPLFCSSWEVDMPRFFRASSLALAGVALVMALGVGNAAAAEKTLTATGTVSKLDAAERTVVIAVTDGPETRFIWTADTKINGTLAPGARVTVRYTTLPDGQNLAHQISVARS
ncbi:MAG TPA: DUF5666 domain-containing protein, partial [Thermoanaerobaculia bacterium]